MIGGRERAGLARSATAFAVATALLLPACGSTRTTADLRAAAEEADPGASLVIDDGASIDAGDGTLDGSSRGGDPSSPTAPTVAELTDDAAAPDGTSGRPDQPPPPGGGGGTAQPPAVGPAPVPAGSPIRIGVVGTMSGIGAIQRGSVVAVQAWAAAVNARGGIAGHPVEVLVVDDQADASRLRAALQQLVEVEGVIAFVGGLTAFSMSPKATEYLEKVRVPMVGGDRVHSLWTVSPMLFPQASAGNAATWIHVLSIAHRGGPGTKIALLSCQEAQQCRDGYRDIPGYAEQLGMQVVYKGEVSIANPDFTVHCRQAQAAGAEYFLLTLDPNSVRRAAKDCRVQGYDPVFHTPQTAWAFAGEPALDGLGFASATFPFVGRDTAAAAEFQDTMARFAPDLELSGHASSGWVAAKLFERAARGIGATPTSAQILDGLWSLRDETLGGLTAPLNFVRDGAAPKVYCYFPTHIAEQRWHGSHTIRCEAPDA